MKARLTLDLTGRWSVEGEYAFATNNLRITEQGGTPQQRSFGVRNHQVQLNVLHFFSSAESSLRPFLASGVGLVRFIPTDKAKASAANDFIDDPTQISSTSKPSFAFGGGIEGRITRWLGLRFDVRDRISAIPRFGVPETSSGPGGIFYPVNGVVHNIEAEAGLVFYLLR